MNAVLATLEFVDAHKLLLLGAAVIVQAGIVLALARMLDSRAPPPIDSFASEENPWPEDRP